MSSEGVEIGSLHYRVDEGVLKFFGLFKHPDIDDLFIAPALNYHEQATTEIVILLFDKDLNVVDDKRIEFSDVVQDLTPIVIPSATIYDKGIAITAHVCLVNGGFANLYTRINLEGERMALQNDDSYNKPNSWTSSIALIDKYNLRFSVLNTKIEDDGCISLCVDTMDSTMTVNQSQKIEYHNTDSTHHIVFRPLDTPVLKSLNDTLIMMDIMVKLDDNTNPTAAPYSGYCLAEMNHDLDITRTTCYFYDKRNVMVRVPFRNSFDIGDNHIIACAIINLKTWHPSCKTRCLVVKYDLNMNVIWERVVNQEEGYYYPHYVLATEDGGCLLAGYSCDKNYQYNYSYVLKTDADGYLGCSENYGIEVNPFFCYPNPAKNVLFFDISPDVSCQSVEIFTLDGHLVETFPETALQSSNQPAIDISGLNAGVYILKVKTADGKEYSERIVKE